MGILNLTHDESGNAIQRLPVAIKIAIGLGPDESAGRRAPVKLDHFVFLQKAQKNGGVVWEVNPNLTKDMEATYGEKPREVEIVFLDDEIENVFRTEYAWWSATECKCRGQLVHLEGAWTMQAIRRTEKHPEGEPWPGKYKYGSGAKKGQPVEPCGDGCPDLEAGTCKPSGDLLFVLARFPMLGAICRLHTTSYRSVRNLHAGLQQIRTITGGRLAGIPIRLKVQPEKVSYEDGEGKKRTSTAHILSLYFTEEDMKKLLAKANEHAQLFAQQRKYLGAPRVEVVEEEETERAPELAGEFYSDAAEEPAAAGLPRAAIPAEADMPKLSRIHELCQALGYNQAREHMLVGQYTGRLDDLVKDLERDAASQEGGGATKGGNVTPAPDTAEAGKGQVGRESPPPSNKPTKSGGFEF